MRRGFLSLVLGLAAYTGALFLSQRVLLLPEIGPTARLLISLLPMLPALFICAAIIHTIRHLDELQRRLQLEALAIAFAGTALLTFGYGFLEGEDFPRLSMFVVWPLMAALWVIGTLVGRLRYG